jgi:hypothetical protein
VFPRDSDIRHSSGLTQVNGNLIGVPTCEMHTERTLNCIALGHC